MPGLWQFIGSSSNALYGVIFLDLQQQFDTNKSRIAVVKALNSVTWGFAGIMHGALVGRFGGRAVGMVCTIGVVAALILAMLSQHLWQLYLTYGILQGVAVSAHTTAALSCVCEWFNERRTLAVSLVMIGTPLSTLVWSPVATSLEMFFAWRNTLFIFAGIQMQTMVLFTLLRPFKSQVSRRMVESDSDRTCQEHILETTNTDGNREYKDVMTKDRAPGMTDDPDIETNDNSSHTTKFTQADNRKIPANIFIIWLSFIKDRKFLIFISGQFLSSIGDGLPFGYIIPRAILLGHSESEAALLSSIFGLVGLVCRLLVGIVGNWLGVKGRLYATGTSAVVSGLLGVLSMASGAYWFLAGYSVLFGMTSAVFGVYSISMLPDVFGTTHISERLGLTLACSGISYLLGNLVAGVVWDATGVASLPFAISGAIEIVGGVLILICITLHLRTQPSDVK